MKKIIISTFCLVALYTNVYSQDIHFSQVNETPLQISPANTGFFNGYMRASLNYRNQWMSMGNNFGAAFNTGAVAVDGGVFKTRKRKAFLGLGFIYTYDRAGSANLTKNNMLLNVAGIVKLNKKSAFSAGLALGVDAASANYNKLRFASQFDGNQLEDNAALTGEPNFRQYTNTDIGMGIGYEYRVLKTDQDHDDLSTFKIVFGAYHLNTPVQDYAAGASYRIPVRVSGAFTSHFDFEDTKFSIEPTVLVHSQAKARNIVVGSFVKYRTSTGTKITGQKTQNALGFGLFYRVKDAFIPQLVYDMNDYSFTISYDVNVSGYRPASRSIGGFEIGIRFNSLASSLFDSRSEFR